MARLQPPNSLSLNGNLSENWRRFKQQFNIYSVASGVNKKDDDVQAMTLLHVLGPDALEVYNTFTWGEGEDKEEVDDILAKFEEYCNPRKNVTYERHVFNTRNQKEGETIDSYVTDLRQKASSCEFDTLHDSLIRDRLVCGIKSDVVRARLLRENDLNLQKALDICRSAEASQKQLKDMEDKKPQINAVRQYKGEMKTKHAREKVREESKPTLINCTYCGSEHKKGPYCPAFGKQCTICKRYNHFAKACMQRKARVHAFEEDVAENTDESFFVDGIKENKIDKDWKITLQINETPIIFKIDSGAQCNVINKKQCVKAGISGIEKNKSRLVSYSGHEIKTCGKVEAEVVHRNKYYVATMHVVDSDVMPVIGLPSCLEMNLIKRVYAVNTEETNGLNSMKNPDPEDILDEYSHLFTGIGCLPGEYEIKLDPTVLPKVCPPRKIPHTLKDRVKQELDRMEESGIISPVEEPTKWVNQIVIIEKPNGRVRVCLDPKELNRAIQREHYPMKTVEDVAASLSDAQFFTKLDATQGFYQIKLQEESSWYTTFNTPFGRYRFLRLPFGISSASEIFQRTISQLFEKQKCEIIVDDILIWGRDRKEHDQNLTEVLNRAEEVNLRFNKDKCLMRASELEYVGHTFGRQGLQPSKSRIQAVLELPYPENKKELQRFLGMVNYLGKFIPNMSTINKPLRELLEKEVEWHWTERHQKAVDELKQTITTAPVLKYYDVKVPVKVSVDASSYGLGACLLQQEQPVAYASRSLNSAEGNYAQIEKEMLAIVFGLTKFHDYVYGKKVHVETDHKPLESLFRKPLSTAPQRLQRMMLRVQKYDLEVNYSPGKELYIADTLSRAVLKKLDSNEKEEFEIQYLENRPITTQRASQFQVETERDTVLRKLKETVLNGWPVTKQNLDPDILPYWNFRDEISIVNGLLIKGDRIITPEILRSEMLSKIHSSHLGTEKCLRRAREILYWPGITGQIKDIVAQCSVCAKYRNQQPKEPLIPQEIPERPWQILASDVFHLDGDRYIVLVDYYSKFFEVSKLKDTKTSTVVNCLKQHFARHGIPDVIKTDNGPEYASEEFSRFASSYNFEHLTSSPRYAQSNGMAERTVQTAKKLLKKAMDDGKDPYLALLELRNTPLNNVEKSPAQLLMGRRTKTLLPIQTSLLKPAGFQSEDVRTALRQNQDTQKKYYDRGAKSLVSLQPQQSVRMRDNKSWRPAKFVKMSDEPRSYIVKAGNHLYRRNRRDLLITGEKKSNTDVDDPLSASQAVLNQCASQSVQNSANQPVQSSASHPVQSSARHRVQNSASHPVQNSASHSVEGDVGNTVESDIRIGKVLSPNPQVVTSRVSGRIIKMPSRYSEA